MSEMTLDAARMLSQAAVGLAKEDPGKVFEVEALHALALVRKYDAQLWARTKKLLMGARVSLKDLFPRFPAVRLAESDREHYAEAETGFEPVAEQQFAGDMLDDCPMPNLVIPKPYSLRASAVMRTDTDQEGAPVPHVIAFAPVLITGRMRDAVTADESVLVSWRWPGGAWQSRVVERSAILIGRKLSDLANIGFPVADDTSKSLVGYLHRLEAYNRKQLPCAAVSSHLGWQGENGQDGFLLGRTLIQPDGTVRSATALDVERPETWDEKRVAFHGLSEGDDQIVDAFHSRGTLQGWTEAAALLQPYPKALIGLYGSFCPVLLELFNVPNFIIDWANRTSTGKTTIVRVVASAWGCPDERTGNSVIGTWDATRVWTERASAVLNALPLILDDTKKAKSDRSIAELIYAVANGRGRGRGSIRGMARTCAWRTVLFSTGEQPATSYTQDGGTRTRTISIRGLPFGRADLETGKTVAALTAGLLANYGHAGREFVCWLMRERDRWPEWEEYYRARVTEYSLEPPSPEAGRLAQYAALISVAGEMLHRALTLPWAFADPIPDLWASLASEAAEAAGEVRALHEAVSWAWSHEPSFYGRMRLDAGGGELVPTGGAVGRWDRGDSWEFVAFFPNVLRDVLKAAGFHYETIVTGWRERGWIDHRPGKFTKDVRAGGGMPKMLVIRRDAIEAET